jgi:RNase P subunit RPR2
MKGQLTKKEIELEIIKILSKNSNSNEIRKIKKLAMGKNIKLGASKKLFCRMCCSLFNSNNSKVRIKKGFKIIKCKKCNKISRYKLN